MKLYWGSLTKYPFDPHMSDEEAIKLLGKWRGENYLRHKTELGRALSFCAGMTLKEAFSDNGINLMEIKLCVEADGKPSACGVEFNLSHSGEVALVAVSRDLMSVGCDVQKIENKTPKKNLAIAKRFFSVSELEKMQDLMQEDSATFQRLFYLTFSAKESYIKMTGEGLKRPMNSFEVPIDGEVFAFLKDRKENRLEKIVNIDGENVCFTYYSPESVNAFCRLDETYSEYFATTCKKTV